MPEIKGTTEAQAIVSGVLELLGLEHDTGTPGAPHVFKITDETAQRITANVGQRVIVDSAGNANLTKGDSNPRTAK